MFTFDSRMIDSTGAFLIGELERLDPTIHDPLVNYTWKRDIDLRQDVTIADETSSFTLSNIAAVGGIIPNGKNWIGKDTNAIAGVALDIGKTVNPLYAWGMELGYTILELESAQKLGRPIDQQKLDAIKLKHEMDIDEQVYIGDTTLAKTGLLNNATVTVTNAPTGVGGVTWALKTPAEILADINLVLTNAWAAAAYAVVPSKMLIPPKQFGYLVNNLISTAGTQSILSYLQTNSLCMAINGRPLEILPTKWLTGRGVSAADRIIAYTQNANNVRFPLVPLQRTPLEYRAMSQLTYYYGRLGVVEVVYPETMYYLDGV